MAGGVSLTGDWAKFNRVLGDLAKPNFKKALKEVGAYLVGQVEKRFAEETGPDGETWKPSQRAIKKDGQTLTDTRHLRNSFDFEVDGDDAVEVGTNVEYASAHQFGEETGKGGALPARPFIGFNQDDEGFISEVFEKWLKDLVT